MPAACVNQHNGDSMACLAGHGTAVAVSYQPTSRFWPIQWTETGIYLALAALLAGFLLLAGGPSPALTGLPPDGRRMSVGSDGMVM